MHGKKVHTYDKIFYKISYPCQKVHMHVKCWCGELVFLPILISHGSFFSHSFHMIFTHIVLVLCFTKHSYYKEKFDADHSYGLKG